MKLLLSHIADPDGITPIILLNLLKVEFEYELFEVKELSNFIEERIDTDYFDKYEDIFIVDLGITKECADKIVNSKYKDKFKMFDHHESNKCINEYQFATVMEEVNGFKECGTTLFFNYLVKNYDNNILTKASVITFVELVRENDTWQFTDFKEESMNLSTLFGFYGKEKYVETYTDFLKNNDNFYFSNTELVILECLNKEKEEYLEKLKDTVIIKNIRDYKVGIVFAEKYRSEVGNYIALEYKDKVDIVAVLNLNRSISLRGININKPVNKFAEMYDGGGHPLASGMPYPEDIKQKIITYIFGDDNGNK